MTAKPKHTRLTVDIPPEWMRRLRLVAAQRDISVREYVVEAIEQQLAEDSAELAGQEGLLALTARADPVLAELWDNEQDAAYDQL